MSQNPLGLDEKVRAQALAAGLHKVVAKFLDCVAAAARAAAADLADMPPIDGTTEPWPAMRMRSTDCKT
jgi:hypothetical protein